MANILDIVVIPTYSVNTLAIADASTYDTDPPTVGTPEIEITPPGFPLVTLDFVVETTNIFNSTDLGITVLGSESVLPDGIYCFTYKTDDGNSVEKSIMRIDKIQQKFDQAFMQLDMMECDGAIKTQSKVELNAIWFMIQGSLAAANNCANIHSATLYNQADRMLDSFINTNCGCSGTNYTINFTYN